MMHWCLYRSTRQPTLLKSAQYLRCLKSDTRFLGHARCISASIPCRYQSHQSSNKSVEKPYYLTTPIFYVNAAPHVGHLYTSILADVWKRWQELQGRKTLLCSGTDEHGMKIQLAAHQAGMDPKSFCNIGVDTFKSLADTANIKYDRFIRTTDPDHYESVQHFWRILRENNLIELKKHTGWYSIADEAFYPPASVEKAINPATGQLMTVSKETGRPVEWTSEENYHFKLSQLQPQLLEFYKSNPNWIVPHTRYQQVIDEVQRGLEDLSISRPKERLSWGIPVPGNDEHTIYVWLDALINYITFCKYPWAPGTEATYGWPADLQIIGKDIVRFHCIYWPAFLLAIGITPPKQILTHAHWTMAHRKMSKSVGNVVNPFHAISRFGVDTMRFYLCHDGGIADDGDYSNEQIIDKYSKYLQRQIGSLVTRVCSRSYDIEEAVRIAGEGKTWLMVDFLHKTQKEKTVGLLRDQVDECMGRYDFSGALKVIMKAVGDTHKYIHTTGMWLEAQKDNRPYILYNAVEALRISAILLQPFMPDKMERLLTILGVKPEMRQHEHAVLGGDFTYGVGASGSKEQLFPPLSFYE